MEEQNMATTATVEKGRLAARQGRFRLAASGLACWLVGGLAAWGGIVTPLYVGNLVPATNEYGRTLPGSYVGEAIVSRVEIRVAVDGIIRPPGTNGEAHALNPLLTPESAGGMGMNAMDPNGGLFAMVFAQPPAPGTKLFARVYNAPTAAEASFCADSAVLLYSGRERELVVAFGAIRSMDEGDDDGDGLSNAWEKSLGTHERPGADYDGDGMGDWEEWRAGTDPTDRDSLLAFSGIRQLVVEVPPGSEEAPVRTMRVQWHCMPGRSYRLEWLPGLLGEVEPVPVGEAVTAGADEYGIEIDVEIPDDSPQGVFRVRLAREDGT